jgi:hypothetical protein
MALLRPFRQYHENDVINLFSHDWHHDVTTNSKSIGRGAIVKLNTGYVLDDELENVSINNNYANTVSDRWSVKANVRLCGKTDTPFGMLLYDVKEVDENGEKLIFNPRKADEMQVALSGQAVPILTRGLVMMNGVTKLTAVEAVAGGKAWTHDDGGIATSGVTNATQLGVFLGGTGANGDVLLKLNIEQV